MIFPNPTTYRIRINYHDFDGNFVEAKEVILSDNDLTEPQAHELDVIIGAGTDVPVCQNCLTSRADLNVSVRPGKGLLCDTCVELLKITGKDRRSKQRRKLERRANNDE